MAEGQTLTAAGGPGKLKVTNPEGVAWSAVANADWITIPSGSSGSGRGTVSFVASKNSGAARSGTITVGRQTYFVQQESAIAGGLLLVGSFPHLASGAGWDTTMTLVNTGTEASEALLNFFGDYGGSLDVPITFPQQQPNELLASTVDQYLNTNLLLVVDTQQPGDPILEEGSTQLLSRGGIDGFVAFTYTPGGEMAVVPLETRNASAYYLPFDNTAGVATAVALTNVSSNVANIPVTIRDDTGANLGTGTITVSPSGQTSFVLAIEYPFTIGVRGTVEFDTPQMGQISVLGLRISPVAGAGTFGLSPISAFANLSSGSGSIAQIDSGGGWQTTITLVNTGGTAGQAQLLFYDNQGSPLSLPFAFPQSGGSTVASSLNETVAPGARTIITTNDPSASDVGSLQLTTTGQIGAYATLRYNPTGTEAELPLETRNAASYVLAFDNTNGAGTGLALDNFSNQAASVPVIVRDDTGTMLGTGVISLPADGHTSFLLTDAQSGYPVTANKRGTVEFDTPEAGQISAANIHVTPEGTFASIPVLAKTVATPTATLVTANVLANDLAWDSVHQQIYLSLPSSVGPNGNTVQVLDPSTGELGASAFAGSEPNLLAVSTTGEYLYVSLNGASIVQRMTLPNLGTDIQIALGSNSFDGPLFAGDLQPSPAADGTVAVVRNVNGTSPAEEGGVVIYDDATARPGVICGFIQSGCSGPGGYLFDSIQWNTDGSVMFGSNDEDTGDDFYSVPVTANGFGTITDLGGLGGSQIHFDPVTKYVYEDNGSVIDPVAGTKVGTRGIGPDGTRRISRYRLLHRAEPCHVRDFNLHAAIFRYEYVHAHRNADHYKRHRIPHSPNPVGDQRPRVYHGQRQFHTRLVDWRGLCGQWNVCQSEWHAVPSTSFE